MKTYTITWKMYGKFGIDGFSLCRERVWPLPMRRLPFDTPVEFYQWLVDDKKDCKDFRLICCGKLVARFATYQGV